MRNHQIDRKVSGQAVSFDEMKYGVAYTNPVVPDDLSESPVYVKCFENITVFYGDGSVGIYSEPLEILRERTYVRFIGSISFGK